jgi:YVTN family beta-propeller protein
LSSSRTRRAWPDAWTRGRQGRVGRGQPLATGRLLLVVLLAAGAMALLFGGTGLLTWGGRDERSGAGVAQISAAANQVRRVIDLANPNDVETGMGSAWATGNPRGNVVLAQLRAFGREARLDLGRPTAMVPDDLAVGEGAVWVLVANRLHRIDPVNPDAAPIASHLGTRSLVAGLAVGVGSVWVVDATRQTLRRIDPATGRVIDTIPVGSAPDGVAVGEGAVWVTSAQSGFVVEVSPTLGRAVRGIRVPGVAEDVAVGAGHVWVTATERDAVARIDPISRRVTWIDVGDAPTGVSVAGQAVWVANSGAGTVSRIDTRSGRVIATVSVPRRPYRIAANRQGAWVTFLGAPLSEDPAA